jgi:3-dehydroquinate synthase
MSRPIALDVAVPSEDLSYTVRVGAGLLDGIGGLLTRELPRARRVRVISDDNVWPLHGETLEASLVSAGLDVSVQTISPGERSKTPAQLLELVSGALAAGLSRHDVVVALGGGVVGDIAGLTAALFMRGIPVVQCPTSLLAQVDASVGGKVAVDLPEGKNLLGAFHFPRAVVIDPTVLQTLPDDELGCGLAEMLKHGALFSTEHWQELLDHSEAIYDRDPDVLGRLVATSVALKAACVSRDPLEMAGAGKGRVLLNLGHTVGHAIEQASKFELKHGQCVGLGLIATARISARRGLAGAELEDIVVHALRRLRLPIDLERWLRPPVVTDVDAALRHDKKREKSTVTYIGLRELGEPVVESLRVDEILGLLRG